MRNLHQTSSYRLVRTDWLMQFGDLGLLLGTRLYYEFFDCEHEEQVAFERRVDKVVFEIGDRGKLTSLASTTKRISVSEGVPPALAPTPAPAPMLARSEATSNGSSAQARALVPTDPEQSFTPSRQLSSPAPAMVQHATDATSMITVMQLLLEREDQMQAKAEKLREDMEAKTERLRKDMEAQLREQMKTAPPTEAVSQQQIVDIQARFEALHVAKMLTDEELYTLEDMVADYVEFESRAAAPITLEIVHTNENASKLLTLIALSERLAADGAFSRQLRRKYL